MGVDDGPLAAMELVGLIETAEPTAAETHASSLYEPPTGIDAGEDAGGLDDSACVLARGEQACCARHVHRAG